MIILSIETSCDDTCISLIKIVGKKQPCFEILSNVISSQTEIHKKFGGIYPTMAKREHQQNLVSVLEKSLKKAKLLKLKTKTSVHFALQNNIDKQKVELKVKNQELEKILEREPELFKKLLNFFKKYQKQKISAIAITIGPGLEPCLWTGVNFAKALAYAWNLPIIPVNHIEGHIFANFLSKISENSQFPCRRRRLPVGLLFNFQNIFPAICLIVSGGHTQLILMSPVRGQRNLVELQKKQTSSGMKGFGKYAPMDIFSSFKYKIIGETRDDAAGECFDKTARILGLGYPGGPAIAQQAARWKSQILNYKFFTPLDRARRARYLTGQVNPKFKVQNSKFDIKLPRPMIYQKNYDFSFSGLKTAVLYEVKKKKRKSKKYIQAMAFEIQQAIIDVLIYKTLKAAKDYRARTIILGGGVVANKELRKQFQQILKKQKLSFKLNIPNLNLCTDNAAMIGITAYYCYLKNKSKKQDKIIAEANLRLNS